MTYRARPGSILFLFSGAGHKWQGACSIISYEVRSAGSAIMREPNSDKLNELVGKLVGDLGAAMAGASILLGDRLGLYKAMADGEPVTSSELAKRTGLNERQI